MTTPKQGARATEQQVLSDQEIRAFLLAQPDFFNRHADILLDLAVPHDGGGAVSLVERKLQVMNEEIARLKTRHRDMVRVARSNEVLNGRVFALTLELVEQTTAGAVLKTLRRGLMQDFRADHVTVWLAPAAQVAFPAHGDDFPAEVVPADSAEAASLDGWLDSGAVCGRMSEHELGMLFPSRGISSAVVLPFVAERFHGIVAIGSRDPARFASELRTDSLEFLASVAAASIDTRLPAGR